MDINTSSIFKKMESDETFNIKYDSLSKFNKMSDKDIINQLIR